MSPEAQNDAERNYPQARAQLEQHDDVAGIYNIGGGTEGIGRALKEAGGDRKIVLIGHGLTPHTRSLLIDGTMDAVITQNLQGAVMNCVRIFANLRDGREPTSGVETTRSQVIFRENLPYGESGGTGSLAVPNPGGKMRRFTGTTAFTLRQDSDAHCRPETLLSTRLVSRIYGERGGPKETFTSVILNYTKKTYQSNEPPV